jgi:hypothetical protein
MRQAISQFASRRGLLVGFVLTGTLVAVSVTLILVPGSTSTAVAEASAARDVTRATTPPGPTLPRPTFVPVPASPRTTTEVEPGGVLQPVPPAPAPRPSLVSRDRPTDAFARGSVVAGFPGAIPVVKKSRIVSSSVSSSDNRLQVTLEATTSASPAVVTEFYRAHFAALSLYGTGTPSLGGASAMVFALGDDSVTLTVQPDGDGSRYSLFGALSAAR